MRKNEYGRRKGAGYIMRLFLILLLSLSIVVMPNTALMAWADTTPGIALSQTGPYTFPEQEGEYLWVMPLTVTVTKTGAQDITNLKVELFGNNPECFELGALGATTLNGSTPSTSFTVKPKVGLQPGDYSALVGITADYVGTKYIGVTFRVLPSGGGTPTYTIANLSNVTLQSLTEGYASGTQESKSITITRTGTGDLANLAVALSGTNAGDFTITQPEATTLNSGTSSTTFIVKAQDGLAAGIYTATVTVSAANMTDVTFTVTQEVKKSVKNGEYVQFGKYNDEPILWQIIHLDDNGNPLLFSDKILTLKAYDAKGENRPDTPSDDNRKNLGSNNWEYSNIRQWLNSTASTGSAITWWQNPPTADNVWKNPYAQEAGFLSNFSQEEKDLIKPVEHKVLLADIDKGMKDGGDELYSFVPPQDAVDYKYLMSNYDNAYYKNVTDSMFLLSVEEFANHILENVSFWKKPTSKAIEQSSFQPTDLTLSADEKWWYWLRTPSPSSSHDALRVCPQDDKIDHFNVGGGDKNRIDEPAAPPIIRPYGVGGIVPACYLDGASFEIASGDGSYENPYILEMAGPTNPQDSTISPTTATFDKKAGAQADVTVTMTLKSGDKLNGISNNGTVLVQGTHYSISDNQVTLKKEYLSTLATGTVTLRFAFDSDVSRDLVITITDSTSGPGSGPGPSSDPTPTPTPTPTTIKGNIVDEKGQAVKGVEAKVITATDGTKTVQFNAKQGLVVENKGKVIDYNNTTKLNFTPNNTGINNAAAKAEISIKADGTIEVKNLPQGTEVKYSVTYDLGNGQKINIGKIHIKVSATGEVSLTTELIDPYGTITNSVTGEVIEEAHVILYYADTERNRRTGKTPHTEVKLPILAGFAPNDNKNPQNSDAKGFYAYMVFPTSDYYLVATKDGYYTYQSPTITVEQEIVKWDFRMNPLPAAAAKKGIERLAGTNRIETALAIAKANFGGKVNNVVLATANNYPDALTGGVLAYRLQAPILLVGSSDQDQDKVTAYIKNYLESSGNVYILGGTGAVSAKMEAKVAAAGAAKIKRLGGANRYETALKIADQLEALGVQKDTPIFLASGENYPDALAISSIAAVNQYPILLSGKNGISAEVQAKLATLNPGKVFVVGLEGALSKNVEAQLAKTLDIPAYDLVRIGGKDRYQTSLEAADYFKLAGTHTCIVTGDNFPDALTGSVYAAKYNAPIILVGQSLSDEAKNYHKSRGTTSISIFGGKGAVSQKIEDQLAELVK